MEQDLPIKIQELAATNDDEVERVKSVQQQMEVDEQPLEKNQLKELDQHVHDKSSITMLVHDLVTQTEQATEEPQLHEVAPKGDHNESLEAPILNDSSKPALEASLPLDVTKSSVTQEEDNADSEKVETNVSFKEEKKEKLTVVDELTSSLAQLTIGTSSGAMVVDPRKVFFEIKTITFGSIPIRIVLQNVNGACPLLSVVNSLALKGQLEVRDQTKVSLAELTEQVGDSLFRLKPNLEDKEQDYDKAIDDVIKLIPTLNEGLVINVKFRHPLDFEFTPALSLFDLLGLPLVHGWLPDQQLKELCETLGSMNFVQAQCKMIEKENENTGLIIREFLQTTANQLTYYGIEKLNETLKDGEIAVLFRNNHFATIYKRRDEIFALCTDSGFANAPNVIWETLCVDGDSYFVDGNFRTNRSAPAGHVDEAPHVLTTDEQAAQSIMDHELAKRLQEQEVANERARESARRQEASGQQAPQPAHQVSNEHSRQKSKGSCSIM